MALILEIVGLVLGLLGSAFLLSEPVKLRFHEEHLEVNADLKGYRRRLLLRRIGIVLLFVGFMFQIAAIL